MPSKAQIRRIRRIVRLFPQNGIKLLLEDLLNSADLLRASPSPLTKQLVARLMKRIPTTFIKRNFRHVESDVVLSVPLWVRVGGRRKKQRIMVYILIEHQSDPDRMMPLRLVEYVVEIYRYQEREWLSSHPSTGRLKFDAVLLSHAPEVHPGNELTKNSSKRPARFQLTVDRNGKVYTAQPLDGKGSAAA